MLSIPTPFPVGDVNVFLLKGKSLTLIDVGPKTKEAWESLCHQLQTYGYTIQDIDQVILTHHHPDHVGLVEWLPENIPIYGSYALEKWLLKDERFFEKQQEFYLSLFPLFGVDPSFISSLKKFEKTYELGCNRPLSGYLKDGDVIEWEEDWVVMETPGHAQSHIVLHNRKSYELIGGDMLLNHISSNPLLEPSISGEERPKPQLQYNNSLKKLLHVPISVVYPGHGDSFEGAHSLIQVRLKEQHHRAMDVYNLLKDGPMTAFEICKRLFPTVYKRQLLLTMSETIGQLDYLEQLEYIAVEHEKGAIVYRRK